MKITYKSYKGKILKEGAEIGIKNRLYVNCFASLSHLYYDALGMDCCKPNVKLIIIAFADNKPVGGLAVDGNRVEIFTRKAYRHKGIGRGMYNTAMTCLGRKINFAVCKWPRNQGFWDKVQKK